MKNLTIDFKNGYKNNQLNDLAFKSHIIQTKNKEYKESGRAAPPPQKLP